MLDAIMNILSFVDDDALLISFAWVNKHFNKIISHNSFWINKNDKYKCAKFNIFDSIKRYISIKSKIIKITSGLSDDGLLSENEYINPKVDATNFNYKLLNKHIGIHSIDFYEYCVLYSGWPEECHEYGNYELGHYVYNYINPDDDYDQFLVGESPWCQNQNTTCIVHGNYTYTSHEYTDVYKTVYCCLMIYNIITEEKHRIILNNLPKKILNDEKNTYVSNNLLKCTPKNIYDEYGDVSRFFFFFEKVNGKLYLRRRYNKKQHFQHTRRKKNKLW